MTHVDGSDGPTARSLIGLLCDRCGAGLLRIPEGATCSVCDRLIPEIQGVLDFAAGATTDSRSAPEPSLRDLISAAAAGRKGSQLRRTLHEVYGRMQGSLALLAPIAPFDYAVVYPAGYGAIALRLAQLRAAPVLALDRDLARLRLLARRARLLGLEDVHAIRIGEAAPSLAAHRCALALVLPGIREGDHHWLAQALHPEAQGWVATEGWLWRLRAREELASGRESDKVLEAFRGGPSRIFRLGPDPVQVHWIQHPEGERGAPDERLGWRGRMVSLPGGAPCVVHVIGSPSLLECALREVSAGEDDSRALAPAIVSATGMVIQLLGDDRSGRVLRMPFGLEARIRAERNHAMIRMIEQLDLPEMTRAKVPRAGRRGDVLGASFFVEQRMHGVQGSRFLRTHGAEVFDQGSSFITELHRGTVRRQPFSRGFFERRVVGQLSALRRAFPTFADAFYALEQRLDGALVGHALSWVLAHGDFKPDNCFFDPEDLRLVGVIDWDQSEDPGLPMLDLIHFIQATRRLRDRLSYGKVVELGLPEDSATRSAIDRYIEAVGFDRTWLPWFFLFDSVDHLAQHVPGPNEYDQAWIDYNVAPVAQVILATCAQVVK